MALARCSAGAWLGSEKKRHEFVGEPMSPLSFLLSNNVAPALLLDSRDSSHESLSIGFWLANKNISRKDFFRCVEAVLFSSHVVHEVDKISGRRKIEVTCRCHCSLRIS